jgi:hypothetical protein
MTMNTPRISDLTLDDLWALLRERVQELIHETLDKAPDGEDLLHSDLSDFPVDSYGSWPEDLSLRREEMYDDDER